MSKFQRREGAFESPNIFPITGGEHLALLVSKLVSPKRNRFIHNSVAADDGVIPLAGHATALGDRNGPEEGEHTFHGSAHFTTCFRSHVRG